MCTARMPTVCVSMATARYQEQWSVGVGYQVNKFEQISSDDHRMSLARGRPPDHKDPYPMMHMIMSHTLPPVSRHTPVKTLPSHNYCCGR